MDWKEKAIVLKQVGYSGRNIAKILGLGKSTVNSFFQGLEVQKEFAKTAEHKGPRVLFLDIETRFLVTQGWGLFNQNFGLEQIQEDWTILSYSAKFLNSDEVMYSDVSNKTEDDLLAELHELFDQSDFIVGHNCMEENERVLTENLEWIPVKDIKLGDKLIGFDEGLAPGEPLRKNKVWQGQGNRQVKRSEVTHHEVVETDAVEVTLNNGKKVITTPDHYWLVRTEVDGFLKWVKSKDLTSCHRIYQYMTPWVKDTSYEAGWVAGFIDGEGSLTGQKGQILNIQVCQRPTVVWDTFHEYAEKVNLPLAKFRKPKTGGLGRGDCVYTNTLGGKWKTLEYVGKFRPVRMLEHVKNRIDTFGSLKGQGLEELSVVSVEPVGVKRIVVMSTSTKTFFAEGFAMHNCDRFDLPKIRARMITRGFPPHSPVRTIDTLKIAKQEFKFTSNRLAYLTDLLCKANKKQDHSKFAGHKLWKEFVKGNPEAIQSMREYNICDVTSLEELYLILAPWSTKAPQFELYEDEVDMSDWEPCGYVYTNLAKYEKFRNKNTGQYKRGRTNLLTKEERASLLANI